MDEIIQNMVRKIEQTEQRIVIGISGHGASGKTTLATNLVKLLGQENVNYMNTDPYIVGSAIRKQTFIDYEWNGVNHHYKMTACHPDAHFVEALERDLQMIRDGVDLYTIGTDWSESILLSSMNKINIIEGMSVAFVNPDLFDWKVYLYTDGETEFSRRSVRDLSERGMELEYLQHSHEERRIQYEVFMHPLHPNFDLVVQNGNETFTVKKGT